MKRIVSILLLAVFLFNVGGYYVVYLVLHHRSDQVLAQKINNNSYDTRETIQIKIPVTLPYPLQQNGFERVDGKFEHNGNFYKLIEQKLENDTVYIICIKDKDAKHLANTFKDYVAKTNDLPVNSKNSLNLFGKFLKDFETVEYSMIEAGGNWELTISFGDLALLTATLPQTPAGPPPRM